jgi:hypothetical protein
MSANNIQTTPTQNLEAIVKLSELSAGKLLYSPDSENVTNVTSKNSGNLPTPTRINLILVKKREGIKPINTLGGSQMQPKKF